MAGDRLTISALTSRSRVLEAITLCNKLGSEEFLNRFGYAPALKYRLRHAGKAYDSKAIAGVAWGLQHFNDPARRPRSFKGGARSSVPTLERLGFTIELIDAAEAYAQPPDLTPGRPYTWDELGEAFHFSPNYPSSAGGMISRPQQNSLLLITHGSNGRGFSYGDRWKGKDLIYAGRGLTGDQQLNGQNLQVAENSRKLFLFESAGPRELFFHGLVRCADYWESTGFDEEEKERRVYQFRLVLLKGKKGPKARRSSVPAPGPSKARSASSFKTRPFDPNRTPAERRRAVPPDPESQKVLSEQADQAHQRTLKTVGLWLKENGWKKLAEMDGAIDLLGQPPDGARTFFEIKSIRTGAERTRVRSGLAQLLEYRFAHGSDRDCLCLVSNRPISQQRLDLLDSLSIAHLYVDGENVEVSGTRASRLLFPARSA